MGWVVNASSRPLYPRKDLVLIVYEVVCVPDPVWSCAEKLVPSGFLLVTDEKKISSPRTICGRMLGGKLIHVSTWHGAHYDQGHWWRKLHAYFCVYCSSNSSALHTLALFYRLEIMCLLSMVTACQMARCPDKKYHNPDLKGFCRYE
jgi:hypothetical protein